VSGARDAAPDTVLLEPRLVLRGSTERSPSPPG
jgi:hypothetical protein